MSMAMWTRRGVLGMAMGRKLGREEEEFLEDLERRAFRFFWEQADAGTGLVRDRALADSGEPDRRRVGSSAATGFGLTALAIGAERGWVKRSEARERAVAALRFYAERSVAERGWFYHFVDIGTGERQWKCEISSIDTALLVAGMLTVRGAWAEDREVGREVDGLVRRVWERMDFHWMLNGDRNFLSMGWKPESGFIASRWDHYCELGILYLLGIASPGKKLAEESWYEWRRPVVKYGKREYISGTPPLFTHQYAQGWMDLRGKRERKGAGTRWFENTREATLAHREFCLDLRGRFPGYEENVWGVTASDSAHGYTGWGGPPATKDLDGTVVPCAAGGSLAFAPEVCLPALMEMKRRFGAKVYQRYGFVDAFHPGNGWVNPDVIGIDVGMTLVSAENLRSGAVWRWFGRNREVREGMGRLFV